MEQYGSISSDALYRKREYPIPHRMKHLSLQNNQSKCLVKRFTLCSFAPPKIHILRCTVIAAVGLTVIASDAIAILKSTKPCTIQYHRSEVYRTIK